MDKLLWLTNDSYRLINNSYNDTSKCYNKVFKYKENNKNIIRKCNNISLIEFNKIKEKTILHDNICKLYEIKDINLDNIICKYLIMDYYENGDIYTYMHENNNCINSRFKFFIIKSIIQGLSYLHENSLLHKNLNTSNIFISYDHVRPIESKIVLSCYGCFDKNDIYEFTAPEIRANNNNTLESDIYSLGICIIVVINKMYYDTLTDSCRNGILINYNNNILVKDIVSNAISLDPSIRHKIKDIYENIDNIWLNEYK